MAIKFTIISLATDADNLPTEQVFSKNEIVIGRSDDVDLRLEDSEVSQRHAIIKLEDDNCLYVEDLNSLNGTIIENRVIPTETMVLLNKKDRIMIGEYLIKPEIIEDEVKQEEPQEEIQEETPQEVQEEIQEETLQEVQEETETLDELPETKIEDIDENIFDEVDVQEEEIPNISNDIFELSDIEKETTKNEANNEDDITLMNNEEIENLSVADDEDKNDDFFIISGTADEDYSSNIDLEAIKLLTLKGKCKRFGKGIEGVKLTLNGKTIVSNAEGKFEFKNIEENEELSLTAEKDGYVFDTKEVPNKIFDDTEISINGAKTFAIKGNVIYKGKGLANVLIKTNLKNNLITQKDGSFKIENVVEGTKFSFAPSLGNYCFEYDNEEKTVDSDLTVNIKAIKLISINGYIKYKGVPVDGVTIDGGVLGKTLTDQNGYYEFKNVKEGTSYTLKAYKEGYKFQKA